MLNHLLPNNVRSPIQRPFVGHLYGSSPLRSRLVLASLFNEQGAQCRNYIDGFQGAFTGSTKPSWSDSWLSFPGGANTVGYLDYGLEPQTQDLHLGPFTLAARIFWKGGDGGLLERNDNNNVAGWMCGLGSTANKFGLTIIGSSGNMDAYAAAPSQNKWVNVAVVYNGTFGAAANILVYYDGILQSLTGTQGGTGSTASDSAQHLFIGRNTFTGGSRPATGSFNGLIEWCYAWKRALTQSELFLLQSDGYAPFHPAVAVKAQPALPAGPVPISVFAISSGPFLQPYSPDPAQSHLTMTTGLFPNPITVNTWLPYFSSAPMVQPADINPSLNRIRVSQPIQTIPAALTFFNYVSQSGPLLPPDLPPVLLRSTMQEFPFLYDAPGWLLSSTAVQLKPVELPRLRIDIVQPVIVPPVVYPQGLITIPQLDSVQLPPWVISRPPFPIAPTPPLDIGCGLTLASLRQRCWERLDDDGTYYPAEMVRNSLNFAQRVFCLLTLAIERATTFSLSANQAFYKISDQISDFMVPLRVSYNGVRVRTARLGDLNRKDAWSRAVIGVAGAPTTITHYAQFGMDGLAIYPSLPGSGTLTLVYSAVPVEMVADGDVPEIAAEQQPFLIDLAIWLLRLPEGNVEGTTLTKEYLDRFTAAVTKYSAYVRARNVGLGYDHSPVDLDLTDLSALHRK